MSKQIHFSGISQSHDRLIDDFNVGQAPHALLLSGISGILKEEFAGCLASALLCSSSDSLKPCGKCHACQQALKNQHPNLLFLRPPDGAKSIKIEQLRSLLSSISLNPVEAGRRVIVIINIESMTVQAQNALLKALEEPQQSDYYILTTSNERAVLGTIISRCRFIRLLPWAQEQIYELLLKDHISPERASELSLLSSGRPGLAMNLENDQQYWSARKLAEISFFSIKNISDVPAVSAMLKDSKDSADLILNFLEQEVQAALHEKYLRLKSSGKSHWSNSSGYALMNVLESIFEARKYKSSNVSWQSIADHLLFSITKEIHSCQWS